MASEKGLGRGLGVLFGEAAAAEELDSVYLPITKVESAIKQPRYIFDNEALGELADSIKQHGIIQPLTVRKLATGSYEIIAGERRWRAARLAGLDRVPVRIIEADDRKAAELALVENLQREDLNPVEEAKGFQSLMDTYLFTQEQVADTLGKSRAYISNAVRILQLDEDAQKALEEGSISTGHAKVLLSLKNYPKQQLKLLLESKDNAITVRQAESRAKELIAQAERGEADELTLQKESKPHKNKIYLDDMAKKIEQNIGRKVKISGNGNSGRVTIEYYSKDDLDELYEFLAESNIIH